MRQWGLRVGWELKIMKECLKSCEGFLRAGLTGHGHLEPFLKNCQTNTFWSVHGIWNFLGVKWLYLRCYESAIVWSYPKMYQALSSSVHVLIWEDKLDYLKNPPKDFKNSFCLWFCMNFQQRWKAKLERPHFINVQSGKITVWTDIY